jgi:hypothetical protein
MSNLTKIALAAALALPAAAYGSAPVELTQKPVSSETHMDGLKLAKKAPSRTMAKAPEILDYIDETYLPEGKVTSLIQSGQAYKLYWGDPTYVEYDGVATEIVDGDDGFVYLKNPFSHFTTDSYIQGKKEGNTYVFDLPRLVYPATSIIGGGTGDWYISLMQYDAEQKTYHPANFDAAAAAGLPQIDNKLVLTINADGSFSYKTDENYSVIYGMCGTAQDNWLGYAEINCTWTAFNDKVVTPPAGLQTEERIFSYILIDDFNDGADTGHYVNIGYDGDDVYIQGIFETLPTAWVKGHKEGSIISVPTGQYLGYYEYDHTHTYGTTVVYEKVDGQYKYEFTDNIEFTVDANGNLSAPGQGFLYTPGANPVNYYSALLDPRIKSVSAEMSNIPMAPTNVEYKLDGQYPTIEFTVSNKNVDGEILNPDYLFYSVYVDGEQYAFKYDIYGSIDFIKRYIPFAYHDGKDFFSQADRRKVYFYFKDNETFGVRLHYFDKDGVTLLGESEITTIQAKPSAVEDVEAAKDIASVKYLDLAGCEVAEPVNGVFLKVVTYTDGSKETIKVMK